MEAPRDIQESKGFRWVGRPSEQELLGEALPGRRIVALRPAPAPFAEAVVADEDPLEAAPRRRFEARDLIALAAIATAVWFAARGSEGIPFHPVGTGAPPEAAELAAANVTLDRQELSSLPRKASSASVAHGSRRGGADGKTGQSSSGSGSGSRPGSKHHPKPPPSGDSPDPLVQATIPGVGTVTVNQPDTQLPVDPPDLPLPGTDVPDTGGLLPGTTTVTLP